MSDFDLRQGPKKFIALGIILLGAGIGVIVLSAVGVLKVEGMIIGVAWSLSGAWFIWDEFSRPK